MHYIEYQDKIYFYYPPESNSGWVVDYDTLVAEIDQPVDHGSGSV